MNTPKKRQIKPPAVLNPAFQTKEKETATAKSEVLWRRKYSQRLQSRVDQRARILVVAEDKDNESKVVDGLYKSITMDTQTTAATSTSTSTDASPAISPAAAVKEAPDLKLLKPQDDPLLLALPSHDKPYYYSDSDDDSDRAEDDFYPPPTTNRGNKLKRGARYIRRGNLGGWPRFGMEHEEAVRKRMRIDLTPTLSLQSKGSAREPQPRLPPIPRNPIELLSSPIILRTFAAKQSHLSTLALSAVNLIETDAPLVRVLARVCDVLRGDRVPFIDDRVAEVKEEHARAAEEKRRKQEEARERAEARAKVAEQARLEKAAAAAEAAKAVEEASLEDEQSPPLGDGKEADIVIEPVHESEGIPVTGTYQRDDIPIENQGAGRPAEGDIPVQLPDETDMDVDMADAGQPSRSTSPEAEVSRRRSGRRAAAKATAANQDLSRERTVSPDPELEDDADIEDELPLSSMLQPEDGAGPGSHLPPSLRRLANPDHYVRSLFVTENAAVTVQGITQALEAEDQYRTLHASLAELQRFLADTIEYQERLGEIRDGSLGVERRRKGLYAILKLLASDFLDWDATRP